MNHLTRLVSAVLLLGEAFCSTGCGGAPSVTIAGAYFPAWLLCAIVAVLVAAFIRALVVATGLSNYIPYQLAGLLLSGRDCRFDPVAPVGRLMTEVRGIRKRNPVGATIAAVVVLIAAVVWIWTLSEAKPSTDDASIDVEVVHIAPLVGGRIIELPIHENELVHKGDLLFRIDPVPYQINVAAAEANLDIARAALGSKRRLVSTQRWDAEIATQQTNRARDNLALSERTQERLAPLAAKGYVPQSSSLTKQSLPPKMRQPR